MVTGLLFCAFALVPAYGDTEGVSNEDRTIIGNTAIQGVPEAALQTLSEKDIARYRRIFELQRAGNWAEADKEIASLENKVLLGHVKFQRYMHPTAYRSKFNELKDWMSAYADHPDARRVYRLARRRQGNARAPRAPVPVLPARDASSVSSYSKKLVSPYSRSRRKEVLALERRVRQDIRRKNPLRAERRLRAEERRALLTREDFDHQLVKVATAHFRENDDDRAYLLANEAARHSRDKISQADWVAGLTAWRQGKYEAAAEHFTALITLEHAGEWTQAAGAYWAARSELAAERPERVTPLLEKAAAFNRTFYGILANFQLGLELGLDREIPVLEQAQLDELIAIPGVRRAIAFANIGWADLADEEIRLVWHRNGRDSYGSLLALAARLNLPFSQLRLARAIGPSASHAVLYPLPAWEPQGGYSVDRAFLFALMRQESEFRPRASSRVGAQGLMQIMPSTASFISRDRSLRTNNKRQLLHPEFNMKLGQDYIHHLLEYEEMDGNLFKLLTAYNGGPGNMIKWQKRIDFQDDALLFIETIPALETRTYIERVLANLWIYRSILGQPAPSLQAVASGAWPPYKSIDPETLDVSRFESKAAFHARN